MTKEQCKRAAMEFATTNKLDYFRYKELSSASLPLGCCRNPLFEHDPEKRASHQDDDFHFNTYDGDSNTGTCDDEASEGLVLHSFRFKI